jgi:hypothetical protein
MALTHTLHDMTHEMRTELHDIAFIGRVAPARQAFLLMWATFTIVPIVAGLDKFAGILSDNWEGYLAPWVNDLIPGSASTMMMWVGAIEILAGCLVAAMPRIGGYVVAAWLLAICVNLVTTDGTAYYDVALRDLGLMAGAIALARLATTFHRQEETTA